MMILVMLMVLYIYLAEVKIYEVGIAGNIDQCQKHVIEHNPGEIAGLALVQC